ncbi:MAG: C40 family peptidase [Bacteroidales bacterium]|nr:C40 family peptidase [Bacteroidales bacterium]
MEGQHVVRAASLVEKQAHVDVAADGVVEVRTDEALVVFVGVCIHRIVQSDEGVVLGGDVETLHADGGVGDDVLELKAEHRLQVHETGGARGGQHAVASAPARQRGHRTVEHARRRALGVPYLWAGTSIKGVDCSGFSKSVYFLNGYMLLRNASQQYKTGEPVDVSQGLDNLQPADLVFFGREATEDKPGLGLTKKPGIISI